MRRITALFLVAVLICASCFTVSAATQYDLKVIVQKYDAASGNYINASSLTTGDVVLVEFYIPDTVSSIAALRLKLQYDSTKLEYTSGSAQSGIDLGTPQFTADTAAPNESYILAYWVKPDPNAAAASNVTGTILRLKFRCVAESNSTVSVAAEVLEAYDRDHKALTFNVQISGGDIPVDDTVLTSSEKKTFQKLLNIEYPASKADIEAADDLFDSFSANKKLNFKNAYPDLFTAYQTAWTTYWALAEASGSYAVEVEVNNFLNASATKEVLALTPETVNAENYQAVLEVYKAYEALSGPAKTKLDSAIVSLLQSLYEAAKTASVTAEDIQIAEEALADFIILYEQIWGLSEAVVRDNCDEDFIALVKEARAAYDDLNVNIMSSEKATLAKSYLVQLENYLKIIEDELAVREEEAEIAEEVSAFMQKWADVLKLNSLTTTEGHEYAIKMMLSDYELLSEEAKARLISQKEKGEQLLAFIDELKGLVPDVSETPVETETPNESVEPNAGVQVQIRELPAIVKILLIAMFASLLSLAFPASLYLIYRKNIMKGCESA